MSLKKLGSISVYLDIQIGKKRESYLLKHTQKIKDLEFLRLTEAIYLRRPMENYFLKQNGNRGMTNIGYIKFSQMKKTYLQNKIHRPNHHFVQDAQEKELNELKYCSLKEILADAFAKPLLQDWHDILQYIMRIVIGV